MSEVIEPPKRISQPVCPGPWVIVGDYIWSEPSPGYERMVARVETQVEFGLPFNERAARRSYAIGLANAQLISASPDLYNAARLIIDVIDNCIACELSDGGYWDAIRRTNAINDLRKALRKADGRES